MWKDLSFKERAALINKWTKEHHIDYANRIQEYDATEAKKFAEGGDMGYSYTKPLDNIYVDAEGNLLDPEVPSAKGSILLPEVTISGRDPRKPVPTAFDPLAFYKYGVEPISHGVGWAFDKALKPVDKAFDVATSPAWWLNKAITGNTDNTVQGIRDWTHTALRDAGSLLSPTRDIGTLRTGFEYAPWNPENPGVFGNDEVGQALNGITDIVASPAVAKGVGKGINYGLEEYALPRARAAAYNNITPWSYGTRDFGSFKISKPLDLLDATGEFLFKPGKIDTTYPRWKKRYDEHIAAHPDEATATVDFDYDAVPAPAVMEFRDQAWAKAMRQPDSDRWSAKIYKDNGDGTVSYDLDAVDQIRTKHGGQKFSGAYSEGENGIGFEDNITTNGGGVNIYEYPDGRYRMRDVWDLQPFKPIVERIKNNIPMPSFMNRGLDKIGNIEAVKALQGNPFMLDMTWDPADPKFWNN